MSPGDSLRGAGLVVYVCLSVCLFVCVSRENVHSSRREMSSMSLQPTHRSRLYTLRPEMLHGTAE